MKASVVLLRRKVNSIIINIVAVQDSQSVDWNRYWDNFFNASIDQTQAILARLFEGTWKT